MCLIDDNKNLKPAIACAITVNNLDVFYTMTLKVTKAREGVLEFLLINHPLDCPICDQGGECDLQDLSLIFGGDKGRFHEYKRAVVGKNLTPFIKTLMNRCIHCTRCVRFAVEYMDFDNLGTIGRGATMEISTYVSKFLTSNLSGNIVDLCPVGALTARNYAFIARSWELSHFYTFDFLNLLLTPIQVCFKDNIVLRILPCTNITTFKTLFIYDWISDQSRQTYDSIRLQRLTYPTTVLALNIHYQYEWSRIFVLIQQYYVNCLYVYISNYFKLGQHLLYINTNIALETVYFLRSYIFNFCVCRDIFRTNKSGLSNYANFRAQYLQLVNTSELQSLQTQVFFFCGINPRLDLPQSNAFFKNLFINSNLKQKFFISYIGVYSIFSYGVTYLGYSTRKAGLISFFLGKIWLCHIVKQYLYISFFISDFFLTQIGEFINLLYVKTFLCVQVILLNQSNLNFNFLDLGAIKKIHQHNVKFSPTLSITNLGVDAFSNYNSLNFHLCLNMYVGSNADIGTFIANIILPSKLFYETASTYLRVSGHCVQTTSGLFSSRFIFTDTTILRSLIQHVTRKTQIIQQKTKYIFLNLYTEYYYQPQFLWNLALRLLWHTNIKNYLFHPFLNKSFLRVSKNYSI